MKIEVERCPKEEVLDQLGVFGWQVWEKGVSSFPWNYDERETAYFSDGEVTVTPDGGAKVVIKGGYLVVFPRGMSCHWNITKPVKKYYKFG